MTLFKQPTHTRWLRWDFTNNKFLENYQRWNSSLIYSQAAPKDFWCSRPENLKTISVELWRNLTQPIDQCSIINAPYDTLDAFNLTEYFSNSTSSGLVECKSWEFDMSLIGNTIVMEWNMVCDRLYLSSVVESCFLAGAGLGSVTSGWISDQYGRKNTLMAFATIQLVTGELNFLIWNPFPSWRWFYCAFRSLTMKTDILIALLTC